MVSVSSQQYLGVVLIIAGLLVLVFSNHMVSNHMMSHAMHMYIFGVFTHEPEKKQQIFCKFFSIYIAACGYAFVIISITNPFTLGQHFLATISRWQF